MGTQWPFLRRRATVACEILILQPFTQPNLRPGGQRLLLGGAAGLLGSLPPAASASAQCSIRPRSVRLRPRHRPGSCRSSVQVQESRVPMTRQDAAPATVWAPPAGPRTARPFVPTRQVEHAFPSTSLARWQPAHVPRAAHARAAVRLDGQHSLRQRSTLQGTGRVPSRGAAPDSPAHRTGLFVWTYPVLHGASSHTTNTLHPPIPALTRACPAKPKHLHTLAAYRPRGTVCG